VQPKIIKMKKIIKLKFGDAASMMEKAIALLKEDSDYTKSLTAKYNFLIAKSYHDREETIWGASLSG